MSGSDYGQVTGHAVTGGITISEGVELGTAYLAGTAPHDMMSEEDCLRYGGHWTSPGSGRV